MTAIITTQQYRRIASWLLLVICLVILMIIMGGATRLTNSGLSITEWKPISGALPPLSNHDWVAEFDKYKQIPEFAAENPDMTLKQFEFIYFMEWSHRQLGRLIGLVYGLPFLIWGLRGRLPRGKLLKFLTIFILIGIQGAIGWWMVASGLSEGRVDVSQYRLAVHLGLAFIILGILYLTYRDLRIDWQFKKARRAFRRHAALIVGLVFLQIISGAFVAGTHAGKTYNTWPLMDGYFVPVGYGNLSPFWRNWTENIAAIQFNHRFLAYIICALVTILLFRALIVRRVVLASLTLFTMVCVQSILGVLTLVNVVTLPLALAHQFTAILVFLVSLSAWRTAKIGY